MTTAVASSTNPNHHHRFTRPPLLPAPVPDTDHPSLRPKSRQVTSRYLSTSTSSSSSSNSTATTSSSHSTKRSQSPTIGNRSLNALNSTPGTQPRSVSADRRRPAATPLLKSVRSLSVSFQGESYSTTARKEKIPGDSRKCTPERRKGGVTPVREGRENCRPTDQKKQLWPGRLRPENSSFMTRSLDFGADRAKLTGSRVADKTLRKSVEQISGNNKNSTKIEIKQAKPHHTDLLNSDTDSVSSKSTTGSERSIQKGRPSGMARFPAMERSRIHNAAKLVDTPKVNFAQKLQSESPVSLSKEVSVTRGISPLRRGVRPVSPMKTLASPNSAVLRGKASPLRNRGGFENSLNNNNNMGGTPSLLSFANDVRRGKAGQGRIADAHELRMMYNRQLQWRFANARVEKSWSGHVSKAERSLYNVWATTSRLRFSVKAKRTELQILRNNMKLYSLLKEQEPHLETWGREEFYHCNSVSGAIKALKASAIGLPLVAGARTNVQQLQDAISSAVDVMQGIMSSTGSLLKNAQNMNLLVSEFSEISAREHNLLDECKELLSTRFMPLQVMQWSLRSHILQAQRPPASSTKEVLPRNTNN